MAVTLTRFKSDAFGATYNCWCGGDVVFSQRILSVAPIAVRNS
jgi:hypothetical protein